MKITDTHKDMVRAGDCILCLDGVVRTVSENDIKHDSFMGRSIFGDSYQLGHKPVKVVCPVSLYEKN